MKERKSMGKEPIRILHVLGTLNLGGAESRVMDCYRNMDRSKVQFDFLIHAGKEQHYEEEVKKLGGRIYRIPRFKAYNYFSYKKEVKKFFRQHSDFHAVHGHMTSTAAIYLPIAKKQGIPMTIAHARSAGVDQGIKGKLTLFFRRNLEKKTDYCFTCSALAGEAVFGKEAMDSGRVQILPNAIEASNYTFRKEVREKIRKELGIEDQFIIGHVGRFSFMKNHKFLLEVFHEFEKKHSNSILLLLGQGECMEEIRRLAKEKQLENKVIFTGNKRNVSDYYQAMDCFIFPSVFEGLPGTVVEAQSAGLPCIISDSITEEVLLTPLAESLSLKKTAEEWAEKTEEARNLFLQKNYEEQRLEKSINALRAIQSAGFDVTTQAEKMTEFYYTSEKKRLLLMVPMLHQGGFERVCVLTARLLAPYYQVFLCVFDLKDLAFDIEGLPVFHLNLGVRPGKIGKIWNVLRRSLKVRELKKRREIDVTYSFGPTANLVNVLSGKVKKSGKGSESSKVWCGIRSYMDLSTSSNKMLKLFIKGSDKIISCSKAIEEELREKYGCQRVETLYNPYDSNSIMQQSCRKVSDLCWEKGEYFTLVSMGREDDIKGFWHLIKAFFLVSQKEERARLLIIGDGEFQEYKKLAEELGVGEKVVFTGLKKNPYPYLALGDIYVLTSYHEGFPNALVEAMTLGIPVIATDCKTGPAEIISKKEYGVLIPNMSPDKNLNADVIEEEEVILANKILEMWKEQEGYCHYKKNACKRAGDFSFQAYRDQFTKMLEE